MAQEIHECISLTRVDPWMYLLFVSYEEGAGDEAPGQMYRIDLKESNAKLQAVFNCNDLVRQAWSSPQGSLWLSSQNGNMYTSAKVQWPEPEQKSLSVDGFEKISWTATTLPKPASKNHKPQLGAIWGSSDNDVFVEGYGGHIYHWDGKVWKEVFTARSQIRAFTGSSPSNVFAVGEKGLILHFDGSKWSELALPAGVPATTNFTDGCMTANHELLACSINGYVLKGSAKGLELAGHDDSLQFSGIRTLQGRRILAAKSAGVFELSDDGTLTGIKTNLTAYNVVAGGENLYLLGVTKNPKPGFITYNPASADLPWSYMGFDIG